MVWRCINLVDGSRCYSNNLFLGWQGILSIVHNKSLMVSNKIDLCSTLSIEKERYLPRYLKELPMLTVGTRL